MIQNAINELTEIVNTIPNILQQFTSDEMAYKPLPNKWSKKEIIGHLIDSATNNHHRFIRAQFQENPPISYNQNSWNQCGYYQQINTQQLINFWVSYNLQLIELFKHIPENNLKRTVAVGDDLLTIEFLIIDYVAHLKHHLKQILEN